MKRIEDPLGKATLFEYDERANLTQRTDALSHITQWSYDAQDRMVQETNAISGVTELGYDAAGNVVRVRDPLASTTRYGYDGLSRLLSVTQPLGQTVRYEWDLRDRLAKKILARSSLGGSSEHPEIRYTYESWGPLAFAKHYAKSSDTTPLKTISYVRNRAGDLTSVTDDSIQTGPLYTYEVDKLGRTTKTFAKYIPGGDRRLDYAYDARGDLVTFTLNEPNESLAHVYTYAADSGRIATALFPGESTALSIARWPHDGVRSIDYPGGVRREVDYDVRGPVSEIRIQPPSGTPLIEKWTYTYTDVLNVATMTDGASRVTTYQYDALDRLTQADHPAMPAPLDSLPDVENFTYDGVGNRTMSGYAHDANHRMRESPGHTYDYDEDGNLVTRDPNAPGQVSNAWTMSNWLMSAATSGSSSSSVYDPLGRRIATTTGGVTTWYVWNGMDLAADHDGSGGRKTRYAYAIGPSPTIQATGPALSGDERALVLADAIGVPRQATRYTGTTVWRAVHAAFGKSAIDADPDADLTQTVVVHRFPGQTVSTSSDTIYNTRRYYDPETGRYLSEDPMRSTSGWSRYAYANASPMRFSDPLGLELTYLSETGMHSPQMKSDVDNARASIRRLGLSDPFEALERSKRTYNIREPDYDVPGNQAERPKEFAGQFIADLETGDGTILWDPHAGLALPLSPLRPCPRSGVISPASNLYHEGLHATGWDADPVGFAAAKYALTTNPNYPNPEEERATEAQNEFSRRAGEPLRLDYYEGGWLSVPYISPR